MEILKLRTSAGLSVFVIKSFADEVLKLYMITLMIRLFLVRNTEQI